jgi:ABC-type polysaccharide/polyol phosphate transport system ATPase subunit
VPILEARDVSKRFRIPSVKRLTVREHVLGMLRPTTTEELVVLDRISFAVERGETLGIMGRNGSGKSTLLKILAGIYSPDGGQVIANGPITPILELGVGWNPELDAIDNILLLGSVMGLGLKELHQATDEILAFAELERFAHLKLQHYSSGMASRLGYAVAFKAVREILILDEIFAVGDVGFRQRCEERYKQLHSTGHTVIVVSHDPLIISSFCTRALLLDRGRVVAAGNGTAVADAYLTLLTCEGTADSAAGIESRETRVF